MVSKRMLGCTALTVCMALTVTSSRADMGEHDGLFVLGQSARVEAGQEVEAAVVVGGDLFVEGRVRTVATAIGGDVRLLPGAAVEGSVLAIGGTLDLDETAEVGGARLQVPAGDFGQVLGQLADASGARREPPLWMGPALRTAQMVVLFVLGALLVLLAPQPVQRVRRTLLRDAARTTLAGLVIMVAFVPLCMLLAISLFGIPLIPVAVLVLLLAFVMGLTALAISIGHRLRVVKREGQLLGAMALGMLVLTIVSLIPVLGGMVLLLASFYGAGAVLLSRFGLRDSTPEPSPRTPPHVEMTAPAEQV